jgi:hypothetical protein
MDAKKTIGPCKEKSSIRPVAIRAAQRFKSDARQMIQKQPLSPVYEINADSKR